MALVVDTSKLTPANIKTFKVKQQLWIYCGIDACVTDEIWDAIEPEVNPNSRWIYKFDMAVRIPAMAMSMEGIRVDAVERHKLLYGASSGVELAEMGLIPQRDVLWKRLQYLADAVWDRGLNPGSTAELRDLFYGVMKCEVQYERRPNGDKSPTVNRTALETTAKNYFYARPIIKHILAIKDLDAQIKVLNSGIDSDGRMRSSFNAKVTETGRWSSSKNCFKAGTNLQNIAPRMRKIFIADDGWMMVSPDLSQAESRIVAYRSGDKNYIAACESGDLHTYCARLIWPHLAWTGDLKADRRIADLLFYRDFTHRDMSKRGGHATNYVGSAFQVARHLKVEKKVIEVFQERYFETFGGIPLWHDDVARIIQSLGVITTSFGRRRIFFDRLNDRETLKEAVAFEPQSTVVDMLDLGLLRIWHHMVKKGKPIRLLQQGHDSLLFLVPQTSEAAALLAEVRRHMDVTLPIRGHLCRIPTEVKAGPSWGDMAAFDSPKFHEAMRRFNERMAKMADSPMAQLLALPCG